MKKQKTSMKHLFLFAVLFSLTACSRAPEKSVAVEADLARKATLIAQAKEIEKLDDVGKHVYAPVFIKLARIYAQEKDYRNAISYYQKGISIDSFDSQPLLELAQLYEEMGLYKDAAKRFEQVLSLRPKRTVEDKANEGLARVRPKVLPENWAPWAPTGACVDQPLPWLPATVLKPRIRQLLAPLVELPASDWISGLLTLLVLL